MRFRKSIALVLARCRLWLRTVLRSRGRSNHRGGYARKQQSPSPERRLRRRRMLRIVLVMCACWAVVFGVLGTYIAYEWVRAPGLDEVTPNSADARARAAERTPGAPPPLHIPIRAMQMPVNLRNATVAIEDQRFYHHGAIDAKAVIRAGVKNVLAGGTREGGSTITQQLARLLYVRDQGRSLGRKVRETKIAIQLEKRHSKYWILWQYLNSVPYGAVDGRVVIGAEAAAQAYFSKPAEQLSLGEAALLAGLPQSPGEYDPLRHPEAARKRRAAVLAKMVELGTIPKEDAVRASLEPVAVTTCDSSADGTPLQRVAYNPDADEPPRIQPMPGPLARRLAAFMQKAGPRSGAYVYDATAQKPLFRWRANQPRPLASNTKLFTAAAVLDRLQPLSAVRTRVLGRGSLRYGTWRGDLYLRGAGDPSFGARGSRRDVNRLVRDLRKRGVKRVRGRVLGDGSLFDTRTGGPDSAWRTSIFVGPLAALSFDRGRSPDEQAAFQRNPVRATAEVFRAALERRGIDVSGRAGTGTAPRGSARLASVESRRIEQLVRQVVKWSDSFGAEVLLKDVAVRVTGRRGSTAVGAREARRFARSLGVRVRLQDGSGLCRKNKASPREVVRLLNRMRPRKNFPAFFTALPVAGRDGTLYNRMRSTPARDRCSAKTATLGDVSNLSGYCRTRRGHTLVFSFMMERIDVDPARALQDRMVNSVVCDDARLGPPDSATLVRPPMYGGGPKKIIALTFDDGPSRQTRRIVSRLLRFDAGATFFQTGNAFRSRHQPIGRYERRHGLTLGSHTTTHPDLGKLSRRAQRREILRGARAITRRGGPYPRLFRPPYDSYNADTLYALRDLGMRIVLQTVDTQDWHDLATRKTIVQRALQGVRPGGIILMHDGGGDRTETVAALPRIIKALHAQGYRLVNVPTLLRENPPPFEHRVPFSRCEQDDPPTARPRPALPDGPIGGPWTWRAMLRGP